MSITADFTKHYRCIDPQYKDGKNALIQVYRYRWPGESHKNTRDRIVAKVVKSESAKVLHEYTGDNIPREAKILKRLGRHPNIVAYIGYCNEHPLVDHTSILLEFCMVGNLDEFHRLMIKERSYITNKTMWNIFKQLARAIAFLHDGVTDAEPGGVEDWKAVVHRDIRPKNVFIHHLVMPMDWSTMQIRLGDFSVATFPGAGPSEQSTFVTSLYWAPEVSWTTRRLTYKTDVWAVGAIIHELAHGVGPTCNPKRLEERWKKKSTALPYADWEDDATKANYWAAHAPRIVMGIRFATGKDKDFRFEIDSDAKAIRERKCIVGYTEGLDRCMKAALEEDPGNRVDACDLLEEIYKSYVETGR